MDSTLQGRLTLSSFAQLGLEALTPAYNVYGGSQGRLEVGAGVQLRQDRYYMVIHGLGRDPHSDTDLRVTESLFDGHLHLELSFQEPARPMQVLVPRWLQDLMVCSRGRTWSIRSWRPARA